MVNMILDVALKALGALAEEVQAEVEPPKSRFKDNRDRFKKPDRFKSRFEEEIVVVEPANPISSGEMEEVLDLLADAMDELSSRLDRIEEAVDGCR